MDIIIIYHKITTTKKLNIWSGGGLRAQGKKHFRQESTSSTSIYFWGKGYLEIFFLNFALYTL